MKKTATLLIASVLCIFSLNLSAYNGVVYNSLPDKNHPFVLKPAKPIGSSDEGVKGKFIMGAGIGLNLFGTYLEARYDLSTHYNFDGNISGHSASPMYNVMFDYGIARQFSVGAAFGYQTAKITFDDTYNGGAFYYDTWRRIHIAVRGDYHIIAKENINLYTGIKLGYNAYTVTTTLPPGVYPGYVGNLDVYPSVVSVQAHFGFSYFINGMVGFNTEVGIGWGGPYLFAAGLAVKI